MARWGGHAHPAMQVPRPSVREAASMYGTAVAVFLVILVAALQGSVPAESPFPYHIPLDPEGTLELSWNVSYVQEMVHFQLLVREFKAGVLFGMSDRGELENADLVVLWTNGDSAYFGVSLSSGLSLPSPAPQLPCLSHPPSLGNFSLATLFRFTLILVKPTSQAWVSWRCQFEDKMGNRCLPWSSTTHRKQQGRPRSINIGRAHTPHKHTRLHECAPPECRPHSVHSLKQRPGHPHPPTQAWWSRVTEYSSQHAHRARTQLWQDKNLHTRMN